MKTLLLIILVLLVSCKPEPIKPKPRIISQANFYIDSVNCHPITLENGRAYTKWDFDGDSIISGCVRPVSELVKERDSLRETIAIKNDTIDYLRAKLHKDGMYILMTNEFNQEALARVEAQDQAKLLVLLLLDLKKISHQNDTTIISYFEKHFDRNPFRVKKKSKADSPK